MCVFLHFFSCFFQCTKVTFYRIRADGEMDQRERGGGEKNGSPCSFSCMSKAIYGKEVERGGGGGDETANLENAKFRTFSH